MWTVQYVQMWYVHIQANKEIKWWMNLILSVSLYEALKTKYKNV